MRPSNVTTTGARHSFIAGAATLAAAALLFGGVVVPTSAQAAAGLTVSGQVFRDYDGNGDFDRESEDNGPREMGLENVTVNVYDDRGHLVGDTTTAPGGINDAGGAWSLRGLYTVDLDETVTAGAPLRVEFIAAGYNDTFSASPLDNNASVRFISAPAAATTVNYGVSTPEDYSTSAPPIVSAIQSAGAPESSARNEPAVVAQYWNSYYKDNAGQAANGNGARSNAAGESSTTQFPARNTLATFEEVGAVWGTAYQNSYKNVYASATYKRLSGLGDLGIGGIYRIPVDDQIASGQRAVSRVSDPVGFTVDDRPIANVPGERVNLGEALSNTQRGLALPSNLVADEHAFANAGKIGIGSITVSADQQWLYFVNLHDSNLYRVNIADPENMTESPYIERIGLALSDGQRPWAVTEHHARVYVGYVDVGTPWQTAGSQSGHAYVMSASVDDIDAAARNGAGPAWTSELEVDLGYQKGPSYNTGSSNTTIVEAPWLWRWNSWVDEWSNPDPNSGLGKQQPSGVGYNAPNSWGYVQTYPQAILSDIEFSDTNDLVIGLMDRTSLQAGNRNRAADNGNNTRTYEAISSGDTLIAAFTEDGYVLENNGGLVDGRTSDRGEPGEGVGGREFFADTNKIAGGSGEYHRESTLGGIAAKTGYNGVISAVIDPLQTFNVTGLKWLDTDNGNDIGGYQHTSQQTSNGSHSFQKAGGLGNIQALSEQAPLQVGDRVWFDANHNGIQDAGEPPLEGIVVTATPRDGGQTLTATTDANGNYLFDSRDEENPLQLHTDYDISFDLPGGMDLTEPVFPDDSRYSFITWGDLVLTTPHAADGTRDAVDSNPDPETGKFAYTTGAGGQNDHSLDAGYFADLAPVATIEKFDGKVEESDGEINVTEGADADTFSDGATYDSGDSKTIVIRLTNESPEPLKNVVLTDDTLNGAAIKSLRWWLPGETAPRDAAWDPEAGRWTYAWAETSDVESPGFPATTWAAGDVIIGEATLTVDAADDAPHRDTAAFTAAGAISGNPIGDSDPYNAYTGGISVIKYDGNATEAPVWDDTDRTWDVSESTDANSAETAVNYTPAAENSVRYIVRNVGNTWLTNVRLNDVTAEDQPQVTGWVADLSQLTAPDGDLAGYSNAYGVTADEIDILFGPGQSFTVEGTLILDAQEHHQDEITVLGTVVVPAADGDGAPTGSPSLDDSDSPILAPDPEDPDEPFDVSDEDPFHARASAFFVQKRDANGEALTGSGFEVRIGGPLGSVIDPNPLSPVDGKDGLFLVAGLSEGTYWLVETDAPEGHELLPQPVEIHIAADSTVTVANGSSLVAVETVTQPSGDDMSTVVVTDVAARVLPLTGGTGPAPYLIVGAAVLILAVATGVIARIRRHTKNV